MIFRCLKSLLKTPFSILPIASHRAYPSKSADHVNAAQPDQGINDPGNPTHISKQEGYKIEAEKTDQSPVYGACDDQDQKNGIQYFSIHSMIYLLFFCIIDIGSVFIQIMQFCE